MEQAKKQGYHVGRPPKLFHVVRENGHVRLEPSEKAVRIYQLYMSGISVRKIAAEIGEPISTVWRTLKRLERMCDDWEIQRSVNTAGSL